jgi:spermidine synthase
MTRTLLYSIVFIEGFCSLGAEIIALRRLLPHVGSAIVVTAPTIGFFLLALALGYAAGAKVTTNYSAIVARNFLIAASLTGVGLAGASVDWMFAHLQPLWVAYLFFIGGVLSPIAWLLGQTVPLLSNLMNTKRTGEASGMALYWSTLGSFLGSLSLSLLVMQLMGVSAAVFACALGLIIGTVLLAWRNKQIIVLSLLSAVIAAGFNYRHPVTAATAYADYSVAPITLEGQKNPRALWINNSLASVLDDTEPANTTRYIQHLRHILLDDLGYQNKNILVLGAGGFTLSLNDPLNHYTYVDIDQAIREIAEKHFLHNAVRGEFIVDDARRFIATSERRFDAVVVDVFSSHTSIPSHLVTREFWASTRRVLKPDGVLLANLILDGKLETPYARNLLTTIDSIFGRCAVDVLHKSKTRSNVEVTCFASSQAGNTRIYEDEKNTADFDRLGE